MSELHVSKNGVIVGYYGHDATQLFRVRMLKSAIELHKKTGLIPTRGVTITKMMAMAGQYTGQKYKRGEHDRAASDLNVWIQTMLSALPVNQEV